MNLFVLPSWYPSAAQPVAGLFVREQVAAVAHQRPAWNVVVGHWGGHDGALSLRDAGASLRALRWRAAASSGWHEAAGWHEMLTPKLSWTLGLAGGGAAGLLLASRRNLQATQQRFGAVSLIHAHVGFPAGWIASRLAAETSLPYVLTEHMSPFPTAALLRDSRPTPALRQAFDNAAATVAVSPALAARIRSFGLPCSDVIANVVDETRFVVSTRPAPEPFVWLTLGALTAQKGVDVLLRAFAAAALPPQVELHVAGDGPQRAALHALADELRLAGRVRWLGAIAPAAVPALMASCHAFVLASRHETFGVVLAEALMSGKPLLATRCGGPEFIVTGGNGRLVPPGDVQALAVAMQQMHAGASAFDPVTLRNDALLRFSRGAVAGQLVALYERVLASR